MGRTKKTITAEGEPMEISVASNEAGVPIEIKSVNAEVKLGDMETFPKGLPIELAFVHQAVQIPGKFASERTLSNAKVPGLKMEWLPSGLVLKVKGATAIVPAANVAVAVLK